MKIAIIIERSDVFLGGAERSVFELSSHLSTLGHEVTLLAAKGTSAAKHIRIICPEVQGKRTSLADIASAAKQYISQNSFDIVHSVLPIDVADVYQPRGGTYPETIIQNALSYDSGIISAWKRATSFFNFRRYQLHSAERKLAKSKSGPIIAALSNYVAKQFERHYDTNTQRLVVIPNGVKTDRVPDASEFQEVKNNILANYPLDDENPVFLLFAANNFRLKGLYQLIKAAAAAQAKDPEKYFHILVAGNDHSIYAQHLARKYGVDGCITFLGPVTHIQNALVHCDVAVLPTFYDPASRFILEGLAMGKPAITTSFNGAADLFESGRHGIVIDDPRNVAALGDAILHFVDRKNLADAQQSIAEDNLKEKVSIHSHVVKLLELYQDILTNRK